MESEIKETRLYDFKRKKPPQITIVGGISLFAGLFLLLELNLISIPVILFGLLLVGFREGIIVSLDRQEYMDYKLVLGLNIGGKWRSFSDIKHIGLVRVNQSQKVWVESISTSLSKQVVKMNFVYPNKKYVTITSDYKNAILPKAKAIAKSVNVKIYDVTTSEKKWIDPNEE